jgi:hypothetical protein
MNRFSLHCKIQEIFPSLQGSSKNDLLQAVVLDANFYNFSTLLVHILFEPDLATLQVKTSKSTLVVEARECAAAELTN